MENLNVFPEQDTQDPVVNRSQPRLPELDRKHGTSCDKSMKTGAKGCQRKGQQLLSDDRALGKPRGRELKGKDGAKPERRDLEPERKGQEGHGTGRMDGG